MSDFTGLYDVIMTKTDGALLVETSGKLMESFKLYIQLIIYIDKLISLPENPTDEDLNEKIKFKKLNLQKLRLRIFECIDRVKKTYECSNNKKMENLLYHLNHGCQYCRIGKDGCLKKPSIESSLEIYELSKSRKTGFILIEDCVIELIMDNTPILVTIEGMILFMDPLNDDGKISLMLPCDTTSTEFKCLVTVLNELALVVYEDRRFSSSREQQEHETTTLTDDNIPSTGKKIANGLHTVSLLVSSGVLTGASKLGSCLEWGSGELCQRLEPASQQSAVVVSPGVAQGLEYARVGSHGLVQFTGKAASLLVAGTQHVVAHVTPHINSLVATHTPEQWRQPGPQGAPSRLSEAKTVLGAGISGLDRVLGGLHSAAVVLGSSFTRSSSRLVTHKYGLQMGSSTENALYSVGNLGQIAFNAGTFTKKGILKTTAKVTAVELSNYDDDKSTQKMIKN